MTTLTEKELMSLNGEEKQDASFATVTADNFVGHLTGVADNAKRLYESQRLVLQGDVSGATDIGQGNTSIDVTVNHAKNADVATSCGYATDSLNASHADLANIATFAHTADKAVDAEHAKESDHSKETDHSLLADNATNANHADVSSEANHATDSDHAILSDTATVALKDNKNRELDKTFDEIIAKELADTTALQSAINDTNNVINTEVKVKLDDHEQRLTDIEITSDLGKVTERIIKIEELNEQQDSRLDSIDTLNTEQNTRLDNVESLANSTATTVTENKNVVDTQINNLKLEDTALSNRITNLDATHKQDIDRLDNSDTNLQEQITSLSDRATGHDTSLGKLFTDLSTTNNNVQTNADNIATNTQGIADNLSAINTINEQILDLQSKTVDATVSNKGITQLSNTVDSSESKATTPKAVQTYVKNYVTDVTSVVARSCFEDIGTAGKKGFGQSACSDEVRIKELGFRALQGTVDPDSDNYYGVYEHEFAGLCCYIPKFWVRIGNENAPQYTIYKNNSIEIAKGDTFNSEEEAKAQGYFLPRAFIDGGEIKRGFFLQKYNSRVSSSNRADGKNYPTSYITNNNLVSITANDMIDRAKLLGDNWNVATCFMLAAHQLLTLSLAQMAEWYTWCKWYKPTQNYQYPTIGLSATNEGLYTHNGMPNGISGLSYVWQFCTGITTAGTSATQGQTAVTSNDIYLLKKEKSFTELTSGFGGDTDAWGTSSSLLSMYDKYTSPLTLTTSRQVRWGNGEYDVLTNGYNKDSGNIVELDRALCGVIPKDDNAVSSNGSNQMASSLIYQDPVTQNLALYFGGDTQPCFSRLLYGWRTSSGSNVGFLCGCYA